MSRRTISLLLLVVALGLLFAGGFVQFDDTSGFGSERWILLLGGLACVAALVSVVAAWPDPKARLWLGIALAVLTGLLVWGSISNDGFRFIYHRSEGELALLELAIGLVAFVLIANGVQPAPASETNLVRGRRLNLYDRSALATFPLGYLNRMCFTDLVLLYRSPTSIDSAGN